MSMGDFLKTGHPFYQAWYTVGDRVLERLTERGPRDGIRFFCGWIGRRPRGEG